MDAPVTNRGLAEVLKAVTSGMDKTINEVQIGFRGVNQRLDKIENRLEKVELDVSFVKNDVKGLTADLSSTVSKKEFNKLESKVDKYLVD